MAQLLHGCFPAPFCCMRSHNNCSACGSNPCAAECGFGGAAAASIKLGPAQKRAHLRAFLQQVVGRPATLVGTSLGGAVAIDYAVTHPEDLHKLVLIDAQV
jgi:pimeloyl-ACP methyl ester carboxylesterase